jgi:hypothetical protein
VVPPYLEMSSDDHADLDIGLFDRAGEASGAGLWLELYSCLAESSELSGYRPTG